MSLRFDHAVILVRDLQTAMADYQSLGFNPFFGGEHADGKTHNALIVFRDGSYLELLAPTKPEFIETTDRYSRNGFLFMFAQGEGFGGYALLADDLEVEIKRMQGCGLPIEMRPPGGRLRPDGEELRWRSAMFDNAMTPFFIQDDTPRNLRVPDTTDKTTHSNGVVGIKGIEIATSELEMGIVRYQDILGHEAHSCGQNGAVFRGSGFDLRLSANPKLDADRLIMLSLKAGENRSLEKTLTHGAEIQLVKI